ncbi:MAG: hypothetical protein EBS48_05170 [Actinobacteria bacterium]|nr:hypothetical protein [Actinomycetota bacterium]
MGRAVADVQRVCAELDRVDAAIALVHMLAPRTWRAYVNTLDERLAASFGGQKHGAPVWGYRGAVRVNSSRDQSTEGDA